MNSAPARTDEIAARAAPPPRAENGGLNPPAPLSQRRDRGAGGLSPRRESELESQEDSGEAGAEDEAEKEVGSWKGRLTGRDRELVGHLGLVRYLRTNQITELVFRGRAQSVVSARLGELSQRHGNTRALLKKLWFVSGEGKRVQVWSLMPSG